MKPSTVASGIPLPPYFISYKIWTVENEIVASDLLKELHTELQENSKAFFFQLNSTRIFNEILEQILSF